MSAQAAEAKRTKFVAYTRAMRAAVRQRAAETGHSSKLPFDKEERAEPKPEKPKVSKADASKPKWALTEEKADLVEDDEADELVDFANNLDYDAYIDDLEVRQALSVIRERIDTEKAMAAVAEAAEEADLAVEEAGGDWREAFLSNWNDDGDAVERSSVRSSRRGGAPAAGETAAQPDWDASTAAGDTKKSVVSEGAHRTPAPALQAAPCPALHPPHLLPTRRHGLRVPSGRATLLPFAVSSSPPPLLRSSADARQMADELLKSNPGLAAKHSVRSLASIVEKANPQDDPNATAHLPPLKIVRPPTERVGEHVHEGASFPRFCAHA